jgi:hypothetical protein
MTDIVLVPITGAANLSAINNNFAKVQESVNNDVLNLAGGNNTMNQDIDMNGNDLLNLNTDVNNPSGLITLGQADARYYNVSGDTLTGEMNAAGQHIINLPVPSVGTEPMRKAEFDASVAAQDVRDDSQDAAALVTKNQTVRAADGETIPALPIAAGRADKLMSFDSFGNPVAIAAANQSATDLELRLANNVDPLKGARLVGLSTGATVADAIKHVVPLAYTSAAVSAAITYAAAHGLSVEIPDGTYSGADIIVTAPVSIVLRQNAFLDFSLTVSGRNAFQSNPVTLSGAFAAFPVGTTTFAGDFSAYAPGDTVSIELTGAGSPAFNQAGLDFATVQTASATQLVLTTGTRLAYENPIINKVSNAVHHSGSLAVDSVLIPANYTTRFAVGDIIRIENVDGTGGVEGSAFYFEYAKVSAIDASNVTLDTRTTHPYTNPWLVKVDAIKGVKMAGGGRCKRLTVSNATDMIITGVIVDRAVYTKVYRYQVIGDIRRGVQEPSTSNATFMYNGSMSDIYCGGSLSSTDNGAFKVLGCPNMQLANISGGNTKATAQGNYGVFIDFFFTPYRIWNQNLQAENIRGETPNGGSDRGVWMTGVRNGDLEITGGHVFLQSMVDTRADVRCSTKALEITNLVRCVITGDCKVTTWDGCEDSVLNVTARDTTGSNSNRCVWARGGTVHPETGAAYTLGTNNEFNVKNSSANASDTTLYLQQQDTPVVGNGCRDKAGLAASVTFGSGVTNPYMAPNFLKNSLPTSTSWISTRLKGYFHLDGGFSDGLLRIGTNYLWVDASNKLRIHTAKPSADANGVVVGTQT